MEIVIFDTETTGLLQPENSDLTMQPKIIEFYGVRLDEDFAIKKEVNVLINPQEPISQLITNITGINDRMVENESPFCDVADEIASIFENANLSVAHNHSFDAGMLDVEYRRLDRPRPSAYNCLCTVEATLGMTGHRLPLTRLHWMLLQEQFKAHRAKDDVFALVRCFHHLTESGIIDLRKYHQEADPHWTEMV
jgi:DNA polymerase III epsilon subunit family exonuclease